MIKTRGFRRLMPVVNLLVYVAFVCLGNASESGSTQVATQTDKIPVPARFVVAANVPAVLAAFALNATVLHFQKSRVFLMAIPFVVVLWHPVGLWIDRRIGWVPRRRYSRTVPRDAFLVSTVLIAVLAIVVFVQTIRSVSPRPPDPLWMGYGFCAWFAFLLVVLGGMLYVRLSNPQS